MSALDRLARMPAWPARMTADVAAMYMGMSTSSFLSRFRMVGVQEGANVYWAQRQLDALVDAQFRLAPSSPRKAGEGLDPSWGDVN